MDPCEPVTTSVIGSPEALVQPARLELPLLDPELGRELRVSRRRSSTTRKTQVPRGPCGLLAVPLARETRRDLRDVLQARRSLG